MSTNLGNRVAAACILLVCTAAKAGERSYTFYELGHLGCPGFAEPRDINDTGRIVGNTQSPNCQGDGHAFEWHNGAMTDLSQPSEGEIPWGAEGITEGALVLAVGGPDRVLILEDGISTQIGPPPGCQENESPERINTSGTMAIGQCIRDSALGIYAPAVYWTGDGSGLALEYFPEVPDDADGWANDVNDAGVVVGGILAGADGGWAFIWSDGVMIELPNLLGGTWINARGINNAGLIAGSASTATGSGAMSYDMNSGIMTELGPGTAHDVNIRGLAVGHDIIDLSFIHAMLYVDGQTLDLHDFLPPAWTDSHAESINSFGWIAGDGDDAADNKHAWLLVPIYDKGDYDGDGDVDLQDSGHFQRCFAAEPYIDGTLHVGCSVFDFDDDVDLDLDDYGAFQSAFTGPTGPNHNPNEPG